MDQSQTRTAIQIAKTLAAELLGVWDGKECIQYLRKHDYQWKQMEWIGWYFEHRAKQILDAKMSGGVGPTIGNVTIDYAVNGEPWDFKAHPIKPSDGWVYLNDVEAVDTCAIHFGGIGWIIAVGDAVYDTDGSFKAWHAELKGATSEYEKDRVARGAPSRRRKCSFKCTHFLIVKVTSPAEIEEAVRANLLTARMQAGQRNADGSSRRAKYGVHMTRATAAIGGAHMVVLRYPPKVGVG
jgi:hypothetical protein